MKKIIILFLLLVAKADAQTVIFSDGTEIYTGVGGNYTNISSALGIVRPSFAELNAGVSATLLASTISVTNGVIVTGSVTSTWAIDGVYLQVQETNNFGIDMTFTNGGVAPELITVFGRYEGNPAHNVKIQSWHFPDAKWTNLTAAVDDFPSDTVDAQYVFDYPSPTTNFVSDGVISNRIHHIAVTPSASHDFYLDYVALSVAQVEIATAGTYYNLAPLQAGLSSNMTVSAANGTITTTSDGAYLCHIGGTGTGSTNTTFTGKIFKDGAATDIWFERTIGSVGQKGNAHAFGYLYATNGTVFDVRVTADKGSTWATFVKFTFDIKKIGN